ncbi:MAG: amidohydrolase family protein [Bacteroidota bacterium]
MKIRRLYHLLPAFVLFSLPLEAQNTAGSISLDHYRPVSIYHIPVTEINKAGLPVIDAHSHDYAASQAEIRNWVRTMDSLGIEKTVILSMQTGAGFDSVVEKYSAFPGRFDLWCGFDYTGYDTDPGWVAHAIAELERCHALGAKGVGELGDKGDGLLYSKPVAAYGLHINDPQLRPLLEKCGELGMPVNIHVAEPYWMYEPADSTNDGLMNAIDWKVDMSREGKLNHEQLVATLEDAVKNNPGTTFIACHFANCSYDLEVIGRLLDRYPNLYVDNAARYAETATIPRYMKNFYKRYQNRILYGTDMGMDPAMYRATFRILETADEHFYLTWLTNYHWASNGFDLPASVLKKIYKTNAEKLF